MQARLVPAATLRTSRIENRHRSETEPRSKRDTRRNEGHEKKWILLRTSSKQMED